MCVCVCVCVCVSLMVDSEQVDSVLRLNSCPTYMSESESVRECVRVCERERVHVCVCLNQRAKM